ncbi:MAG: hypothetical protein Ct9H300mP27_11730 [Chloroflexota bacterium]|nr:MAG: hypothetical protein Ct9H300mP27_11730 [Chloroflexota bacterium]
MSIVALGVFPYITGPYCNPAAYSRNSPKLQQISREGESGRAKMNRFVHWLKVPIAISQAIGQLVLLQQSNVLTTGGYSGPALLPTLAAIISMTAGNMFFSLARRKSSRSVA